MHRFTRLAVALSRTDTDPALLRYTSTIARVGATVEVRFVHVLSPDVTDADGVRRAMGADVAAHFTGVPPSITRSFEVLHGPRLDQLLEHTAATQTDLLFLGHRQDHPGRAALARRLAMKAACSVWMVPEGSPAAVTRVLVPIDFSEPSGDALRVGTSLAQLTGAECLALHVYFNSARASFEEYRRILRGEEQKALDAFVASLNLPGPRPTPVFEESANVAHAINRVAVARACDLVVLATRGRSRSASILLGSVTEEAIVETKLPLLVVKHQGAQIGALKALLELAKHRGPQFD